MDSFAATACKALLILSTSSYATGAAYAQAPAYPAKPLRMVIALAPGGGVDTTGRFIAQKLSEAWGQPVVADNRPGAGGSIAAEVVARAAPDGYTMLMTSAGITITPNITDVVAGRIALTVASVISTRPMFTAGKLRAIAVVGPRRTPALPEYPTIAESGVPGFGVENWYALFLPGGTDRQIAVRIQQAVTRMLTEPAASKLLRGQGLDAVGSSQEEFARLYAGEIAKWGKVVQIVGVKLN